MWEKLRMRRKVWVLYLEKITVPDLRKIIFDIEKGSRYNTWNGIKVEYEEKKKEIDRSRYGTSVVAKEQSTNASDSSEAHNVRVLKGRDFPLWVYVQIPRASRNGVVGGDRHER